MLNLLLGTYNLTNVHEIPTEIGTYERWKMCQFRYFSYRGWEMGMANVQLIHSIINVDILTGL